VEAFTKEDIALLEGLDAPWNEIKTLTEKYRKGVPLSEIDSVRTAYENSYQEQFKNNEKLVSWASARRSLFRLGAPPIGRGKTFYLTARLRDQSMDWLLTECTRDVPDQEVKSKIGIIGPRDLGKCLDGGESWYDYTTSRWLSDPWGIAKLVEPKLEKDKFSEWCAWIEDLKCQAFIDAVFSNFERPHKGSKKVEKVHSEHDSKEPDKKDKTNE